MNGPLRRSMSVTLCAVQACLAAGGCVTARSTRTYGNIGVPPERQTLTQIKPGETTKEWVLTALGKPTREGETSQGTEMLTYEYTQKIVNEVDITLFLDAKDSKTTQHNLYFEIQDGVVQKFWHERLPAESNSRVSN